jgi:hypothetical protein
METDQFLLDSLSVAALSILRRPSPGAPFLGIVLCDC